MSLGRFREPVQILEIHPGRALIENKRSACAVRVASPVAGPGRWALMMTTGISAIAASPSPFCHEAESAPPDVAVRDLTPENDAPMAMLIAASSSSACSMTMWS